MEREAGSPHWNTLLADFPDDPLQDIRAVGDDTIHFQADEPFHFCGFVDCPDQDTMSPILELANVVLTRHSVHWVQTIRMSKGSQPTVTEVHGNRVVIDKRCRDT